MRLQKLFFMVSVVFLLLSSSSAVLAASDFDWTNDFNIKAEADQSGFKASLAARFKLGDAQINAVLGNVEKPADAYMILRLGEMSGKPTDSVMEKYRSEKGKGWGAMAKSLGIKPGSKEFHALKRGSDIKENDDKGKGKEKGKNGGKGKGKN